MYRAGYLTGWHCGAETATATADADAPTGVVK